jgi:hypothetical protein
MTIGPLITREKQMLTEDKDMAEELNNFFASVFTKEDQRTIPEAEKENGGDHGESRCNPADDKKTNSETQEGGGSRTEQGNTRSAKNVGGRSPATSGDSIQQVQEQPKFRQNGGQRTSHLSSRKEQKETRATIVQFHSQACLARCWKLL